MNLYIHTLLVVEFDSREQLRRGTIDALMRNGNINNGLVFNETEEESEPTLTSALLIRFFEKCGTADEISQDVDDFEYDVSGYIIYRLNLNTLMRRGSQFQLFHRIPYQQVQLFLRRCI